jgi:hypothetical protein
VGSPCPSAWIARDQIKPKLRLRLGCALRFLRSSSRVLELTPPNDLLNAESLPDEKPLLLLAQSLQVEKLQKDVPDESSVAIATIEDEREDALEKRVLLTGVGPSELAAAAGGWLSDLLEVRTTSRRAVLRTVGERPFPRGR